MPEFEESSINEALNKSISKLMKVDTDKEFESIKSKLEEAERYLNSPNEYLIILYKAFKDELSKAYKSETKYSELIKKPTIADDTPSTTGAKM